MFRAVFWGVPFPGFGTIVAVMLLMFGLLSTMLGIVAEYVGLIYEEVKQRPNYVVRNTVGITLPAGGSARPSGTEHGS